MRQRDKNHAISRNCTCTTFTLSLLLLSVKQGSCEYQFLSHWFDSTRNQTHVYSSQGGRSIPLGHLSCKLLRVRQCALDCYDMIEQSACLTQATKFYIPLIAQASVVCNGSRTARVWVNLFALLITFLENYDEALTSGGAI